MDFKKLIYSIDEQHSTVKAELKALQSHAKTLRHQLLLSGIQQIILYNKLHDNNTRTLFSLGDNFYVDSAGIYINIQEQDIEFCKTLDLNCIKVYDNKDGNIPYVDFLGKTE